MVKVAINDSKFRVASRCASTRVSCVAVAIDGSSIHVRDTKDGTKQTLSFDEAEWATFVEAVKLGEFDI